MIAHIGWQNRDVLLVRKAFRFQVIRTAVIAVFMLVNLATLAISAETLRYKLTPNQEFGYEVIIAIDLASKIDTYQGNVLYKVKSVDGETFTVSYDGGLTGSSKLKGTGNETKVDPYSTESFQGLKLTKTEVVLSARGQVVKVKDENQLPYILGNLALLVFVPVPEGDSASWTIQGSLGITELSDDSNGPRGFGPRPLSLAGGPRGSGGQGKEKITAANSTEQFKLKSETKGKATYTRTYSIKTTGEESLNIDGSGTWTFNRETGISDSASFQQRIVLTKGNATVSTPLTITYRLLTSKEREQVVLDRAEAARKAKEAHDKFWAEHNRKEEEAKRAAQSPFTPQETAEIVEALAPTSSAGTMLKMFEKLKKKTMSVADPVVVDLIRQHLKSKDAKLRMAAEDALAGCDPEYRKKYEVFVKYRKSFGNPIKPTGRLVDEKTKLVVGQRVLAQGWANNWYSADILELHADGTVTISEVLQNNRKTLPRTQIQLAHLEVDQPEEAQRQLEPEVAAPVMRTWTDATGQFKIEATLASFTQDKVKLKRKDGTEIELQLDKLSAADQQIVKEKQKTANPFEPK